MFKRLLNRLYGNKAPEAPPASTLSEPPVEDSKIPEAPENAGHPIDAEAPVSPAPDPEIEEAASGRPGVSVDPGEVEEKAVEALKTVYDPEIPVNIYELGLIYELRIDASGMAHIKMTLTSPACPVAGILPGEVESKVRSVPGVKDVKLDLVWDPPWNPDMMSEAARLELGML